MPKWMHSRKGLIEGEVTRDDGEWIIVKLSNTVRVGSGQAGSDYGFRGIYCGPGELIEVRKSLMRELPADIKEAKSE